VPLLVLEAGLGGEMFIFIHEMGLFCAAFGGPGLCGTSSAAVGWTVELDTLEVI